MESIRFTRIKKHTTSAFCFKIFLNYSKASLCPLWETRLKATDVICCLHKMKQSHWLLCITRNCDWSRKITPLSNLTQIASRGMKTYSKSRIELRNLQMLKKTAGKSSFAFLSHIIESLQFSKYIAYQAM